MSNAPAIYRTVRTIRFSIRHADNRPQFDEPLIKITGSVRRNHLL